MPVFKSPSIGFCALTAAHFPALVAPGTEPSFSEGGFELTASTQMLWQSLRNACTQCGGGSVPGTPGGCLTTTPVQLPTLSGTWLAVSRHRHSCSKTWLPVRVVGGGGVVAWVLLPQTPLVLALSPLVRSRLVQQVAWPTGTSLTCSTMLVTQRVRPKALRHAARA